MGLYAEWRAGWDLDHTALRAEGETRTYRELDVAVRRAVTVLSAHGVGPGDVVALMMPRQLAFLELCLAGLALGAVVLPLNDRYTLREVRFLLHDSGARWAALPDALAPAFAEERPVLPASAARAAIDRVPAAQLPADPPDRARAMLMYTSGTTGRPKGAVHTHASLRATVDALHLAWGWSADDVLLHALPVYHVHGLVVAQLGALRAGATTEWLTPFDAERVLDRLASGEITVFMGVPTFYSRMLAVPGDRDLSPVRLLTSGSAGLPAAVHRAFRERFGHAILERYGMTEIGIVVSNPLEGERRPGSIGLPLPGVEARVDGQGVGEILIRGPSLMEGYLGLPEQTAAALAGGWMHTGDLGHVDEDGFLHLVGRAADVVITGGLNIYPAEVEAVLLEHPGVTEAAVVGLPDPDLGEVPVAAFVGSARAEDLVSFCRERLAPYKVPRRIERRDALPRNAMGKVLKGELRAAMLPASGGTG